jgi:hypothetical protein
LGQPAAITAQSSAYSAYTSRGFAPSERRDDRLGYLNLQRDDVAQVAVVAIRPDGPVLGSVDELRRVRRR